MVALKLFAVVRLNIGPDEFRYLFKVSLFNDGSLNQVFQAIQVHLFRWLVHVPGNEIDQIIAARFMYFGFATISATFIYLISRRYFSTEASLFAVLCYLSYWETIRYGVDFRADGLAVMVFLATVYLLMKRDPSRLRLVIAGILLAFAGLVTVKSVYYLPTIGSIVAINWYYSANRRQAISRYVLLFASTGITFAVLLWSHKNAIVAGGLLGQENFLRRAGLRGMVPQELFPQSVYLASTLFRNAFIWLPLLYGVRILLRNLRTNTRSHRSLLLLTLLLPIGAVTFYPNAYPYFYVFIMPAALVLCAVTFDHLVRQLSGRHFATAPVLLLIAIGSVAATGAWGYRHALADEITPQRAVLDEVHRMFPERVPYVAGFEPIASYPKVGFFMSGWGLENYRRAGHPIFRDLLRDYSPVFLFADAPALRVALGEAESPEWGFPLLVEDNRVLRENYIHHWGQVYVAGKQFKTLEETVDEFELLIPGIYTVEAERPVILDGVTRDPGDVLSLRRGTHRIRSAGGLQTVTLRWGIQLNRPEKPPPAQPFTTDF